MQNNEYRTDVNPIWCRGCGNYGLLDVLTRKVFLKLGALKHEISIVSGIGCSSRIPGYIDTFGFNSIHGRALPRASGQKLASQIFGKKLYAVVIAGDGDLQSIGASHLLHSAIRGVDLTCLMVDNHVYAMTKGQTGPTTPLCEPGHEVLTSGTFNPQVDPLRNMLSYMVSAGTGFLAQGLSFDTERLSSLIEQAILYKGFAFVNIQTPCVTFPWSRDWIQKLKNKNFCFDLKEGEPVILPNGDSWIHDPSNEDLAWRLMKVPINERPYLGVIWRGPEIEDYLTRVRKRFNGKKDLLHNNFS